jgi:NAD-dependent dihydropyrimidine dehydrogenase PreA subunit
MRVDGTFIGVEVDDAVVGDAAVAARLREVCPVDIYGDTGGTVQIVAGNVDECVLCRLCIDATPPGTVNILKLYDNEASLA